MTYLIVVGAFLICFGLAGIMAAFFSKKHFTNPFKNKDEKNLSVRDMVIAMVAAEVAISIVLVGARLAWDEGHSYLIIVSSFLAIAGILSATSVWLNSLCRKNKSS